MTWNYENCIIVNVSYLTKGSDNIEKSKNIVFEIKILDNMIKRKIITDTKHVNIPSGLSPVQLKILHYLLMHSKDIVFQRDIEKIIESRRSTTSGILNTMEKNNLIKRVNSIQDARAKQIILTEYGIQISQYMIELKTNFDTKVKDNITDKELEIFFKVTEKIKNNIMNMK